jgi:LysR family glycine cleavage system transcriptional activator
MCAKIARMISPLPPLNAVRAFVAAARHQSFTLAAGELNVTHSAVSRQVQALEAYMGVQLFERRVRQISLTVEGLRFFTQADAALRQIAAATQSVMGQAPGRVVRINVRPTFAVRWLIPRLPHFVERHPGVEPLVLTSTVPPERATDPFDIAIRRGMVGWPPAALLRPFLEDEVCVVASPASLAAHPVRTPTDLSGLALLWSRTRKGDWDAWVEHTGHERIKPAGQMQFEHVHFVVQAAIDGLGFAAVPASLVATGLASGQLQCPFPELRMPITRYYFTVAADAVPKAQLFAQWLESEARSG